MTAEQGGDVRLVEARHGRFFVLETDLYVGRSLSVYGEWTEEEVTLIGQALRPGDCVADVGANIGSHTVPFAKAVGPGGRVMAFEPQPRVFQLLAANVTINGLANVRLYHAACAAQVGTLSLPDIDTGVPSNFGGVRVRELQAAGETAGHSMHHVPIVRLDDVYDFDRLRAMKIDVEGMELDVLAGAQRTIARFRPLIYIENEEPETSPQLLQALIDLDYTPYWHVVPFFDPRNFRAVPQDVFSNMGCVNNLCIPEEVSVELHGLRRVASTAEHPRL